MDDVANQLADAIEETLPGWVQRTVADRMVAWAGAVDPELAERAAVMGRRAALEVGAEVRALLAADVDEQWTNPLSLLRAAVRYPTAVLREAGVPPVVRDEFDERHFPEDAYALTPMSFADVDPALHELGLMWGAAKAHRHLARRRRVDGGGDPEHRT